tara:strand:+ start:280 stop:573 length:294 start_codon:yes stop_codon:yes gene_type:complete
MGDSVFNSHHMNKNKVTINVMIPPMIGGANQPIVAPLDAVVRKVSKTAVDKLAPIQSYERVPLALPLNLAESRNNEVTRKVTRQSGTFIQKTHCQPI